MTTSTSASTESELRAALPIIRFFQAYIPLRLQRWIIGRNAVNAKLAASVKREDVSAGGVPCVWLIPDGSPADRVLLYLHGGGFVLGLTSLHIEMVAGLAQAMGTRALMVDYRLAPDYPFPAALDDCATVYRWLLNQGIAAQNIALAGDSAGGNLTLTTLMALRDAGGPLPAAAACLSPVGDLSKKRDALADTKDPLLHPKAMQFYNQSYVAKSDSIDPLISPVFGNFHGLPPMLIHAGEDEVLRDDAVRIAEKAKIAGVEVRLEIYPRMWHVWQINAKLPQTVQSLDDIARFLQSHLGAVASAGSRPPAMRQPDATVIHP